MTDLTEKTLASRRHKRDLAKKAVDEWRGACVRYFAELEQGLVDTFRALAENGVSQDINDPGFIAQRLKRLIEIAETHGSNPAGKLARALRQLQSELGLRAELTHGSGRVRLDPSGKWRISLRHCPPNGPTVERIIRQDEAEASHRLLSVEVPKALQRMSAFVQASRN